LRTFDLAEARLGHTYQQVQNAASSAIYVPWLTSTQALVKDTALAFSGPAWPQEAQGLSL